MEFVGSDPALKAPTDQATKLHYVKHGPIKNQLTVLNEVMMAVVFGPTGIPTFHGWSTANSITV